MALALGHVGFGYDRCAKSFSGHIIMYHDLDHFQSRDMEISMQRQDGFRPVLFYLCDSVAAWRYSLSILLFVLLSLVKFSSAVPCVQSTATR